MQAPSVAKSPSPPWQNERPRRRVAPKENSQNNYFQIHQTRTRRDAAYRNSRLCLCADRHNNRSPCRPARTLASVRLNAYAEFIPQWSFSRVSPDNSDRPSSLTFEFEGLRQDVGRSAEERDS